MRKISVSGFMNLSDIQTALDNPDFQYRLKAIAALKQYSPEIAVPLLLSKLQDPEFLVRTFVARELSHQQTAESFAALLEMIKLDNTPNVRAEAANSLSLFGRVAVSHLVLAFVQDDHWLLRRSILAALAEMDCPSELYEVCLEGIAGEDFSVQEESVRAIASLKNSPLHATALAKLLELAIADSTILRMNAASTLKHFTEPEAQAALHRLRQDADHHVVAAALENLLP
jgi:HEAT repeat protein